MEFWPRTFSYSSPHKKGAKWLTYNFWGFSRWHWALNTELIEISCWAISITLAAGYDGGNLNRFTEWLWYWKKKFGDIHYNNLFEFAFIARWAHFLPETGHRTFILKIQSTHSYSMGRQKTTGTEAQFEHWPNQVISTLQVQENQLDEINAELFLNYLLLLSQKQEFRCNYK